MVRTEFDALCEASALSFGNNDAARFMLDLDEMIQLADTVRAQNCVYENCGPEVTLAELRKDTAFPSLPVEELLANTEALFDCCVIPKMME